MACLHCAVVIRVYQKPLMEQYVLLNGLFLIPNWRAARRWDERDCGFHGTGVLQRWKQMSRVTTGWTHVAGLRNSEMKEVPNRMLTELPVLNMAY